MILRNYQQALALGKHEMVRKDHRGSLIAVVENLGLHTIQAQLDSDIYIIGIFVDDSIDIFLDNGLDRQRRDSWCRRW